MDQQGIKNLNSFGEIVSSLSQLTSIHSQSLVGDLNQAVSKLEIITRNILPVEEFRAQSITVSEQDQDEIATCKRRINDSRLQMVGILMATGIIAADSEDSSVAVLEFFSSLAENTSFTTEPSGLTHCRVGRFRILLLPNIQEEATQRKLLSELLKIFDAEKSVNDWVLDCSCVQQMSPALLAVLRGYKETLNMRGRELRIVWLPIQALPASFYVSVQRAFSLEQIGNFLFNRMT